MSGVTNNINKIKREIKIINKEINKENNIEFKGRKKKTNGLRRRKTQK